LFTYIYKYIAAYDITDSFDAFLHLSKDIIVHYSSL